MSESNQDSRPASAPVEPQQVRPRSTGSFMGILAIFLALIATGMASYPLYHLLQPPSSPVAFLEGSVQQLILSQREQQQRLASFEQSFQDLVTRVSDAQNSVALVEEKAAKMLANQREELLSMLGTTSQDWLMAEVEYLLRLANQRVLMERDPQGAMALLHAADEIVRDARGITGFELRQAIAVDLGQLEAVERLDVDGLYLQLSVLARQVDQLMQKQQHFEAPAPLAVTAPVENPTWAERFWGLAENAGRRLATLVDYRRGAAVITPVLPPKEEYYLRQNLVLKFQLAELALLRGDQLIYKNALSEANLWLPLYFDLENSQTRAMQAAIEKLLRVDISRQLPDISGSLQVAREMMAKFSQQPGRRPAPESIQSGQPGATQ
jgi:uroporphyrin-III C-methyltransferase